jgi:hypothetical protein
MTSVDTVEDAVRLIRLLSYGDSEQGRRWMTSGRWREAAAGMHRQPSTDPAHSGSASPRRRGRVLLCAPGRQPRRDRERRGRSAHLKERPVPLPPANSRARAVRRTPRRDDSCCWPPRCRNEGGAGPKQRTLCLSYRVPTGMPRV